MDYLARISNEKINLILYIIEVFVINVGTYFLFLRCINKKGFCKNNFITILSIFFITIVCSIVRKTNNLLNSMALLLLFLTFIFRKSTKSSLGYTIVTTLLSFCISYILFFIAVTISSIPSIQFDIQNDYFCFILICIIYSLLLYMVMRIKKFKNGFSFLNNEDKSEFFDVLILNLSVVILFSIVIFGSSYILMGRKLAPYIIASAIIMFVTIRKSFQVYYKQKLLIKEVEDTKIELANKEKEIEKLEQENLNFSKKSHSLAHKQRVLEYKLNKLMLNTEISEEIDIKDKVESISKELYEDTATTELTKTDIPEIDDMFKYMQEECIKNKIDFNLQISGNIYHMINNLIDKSDLEILIADHVKDAIIAINHSDNINKSILVKLGKVEDCYGLYIYDSGIEFEKETLEILGKKPCTTHADEGGTGMGFMNTFDTLRKYNASLIINEIGKPSKDNYTKIIMIRFDNKNEFKVIS